MAAKLLISGLSNTGKTTLLSDLQDTLVIAVDGKKYPFPQPHINVFEFDSVSQFLTLVGEKITAYYDRYGKYPSTIAFDSVSRIFEIISNNCNKRYSGFQIYTEVSKEVHEFVTYIENVLIANNTNVVIVSHATYDADTNRYNLVAAGSFAKAGGLTYKSSPMAA